MIKLIQNMNSENNGLKALKNLINYNEFTSNQRYH